MDKNFVPYVESFELKQLGFDEPCFGKFLTSFQSNWKDYELILELGMNETFEDNRNIYLLEKACSGPTFSQAFRWFREHQDWAIDSWIQPYLSEQPKQYEAFYWTRGEKVSVGLFSSHGEAELACIRKLIEIVKNK